MGFRWAGEGANLAAIPITPISNFYRVFQRGAPPCVFRVFAGQRSEPTHTQALGGVGFLTLVSGMMTKTHVSKGRSAGIKTTHGKGLWTN